MSAIGQQTRRNGDTGPAGRVQSGNARSGAPKNAEGPAMPPRKTWLWFMFILFINFLLVRMLMPGAEEAMTVPYTVFKEEVGKGNVQAIYSRGDSITGRFATAVTYPPPPPRDQDKAPAGILKPRPSARGSLLIILPQPPTRLKRRCPPLQIPAWRHS